MKRSVVLVSFVLCAACSDNNENGASNIKFETNNVANNTTANNMADMGPVQTDMGGDQGTPDASMELDFAVAAEGFMHGNWTVTRAAGGEAAQLRLRHEAGEMSVFGTFQMNEPAAFGEIGGANWTGEQFTTSWTIVVDGLDERFGLAMCRPTVDDDTLGCRLSDPLSGEIADATMTRNP